MVDLDEDGSAAIEFAILGPIYIFIIFMILETGLHMSRISNLDNSIDSVVRLIHTSKAKDEKYNTADIAKFICNETSLFSECNKRIVIEIREIRSFTDIPNNGIQCKEQDLPIESQINYRNGDEAVILYLRVCILVDSITPINNLLFASNGNDADGKKEIISSAIFMSKK